MKPDVLKRRVRLEGFTPIMFDRYAGDNKTSLPVEKKMYFQPGTNKVCFPAANLSSFLCANNTTSVAKKLAKKAGDFQKLAGALLAYVIVAPVLIPFLREEKPILFNGFVDDVDDEAKMYVHRSVARLSKGIPNPKERPVLDLPWALEFDCSLFKNDSIDELLLKQAFERGGVELGIGTYRGVYGKFFVAAWE